MKLNVLTNAIDRLRVTAFLEGMSLLILLGIAMPLKYMADMPQPVRVIGMAHGILFLLYVVLVINVKFAHKWAIGKTLVALCASVIPFGTFYVDAKWLRENK
ncbi:DUF3817 domain-containing protein [Chitinophaga sp. MM2321]|uniref:DUF3817 domain-containing protein n=1 Tax=Chitinophaga sp. MM2321 TaxID=3137178 RepID=UPI0032D59F2D